MRQWVKNTVGLSAIGLVTAWAAGCAHRMASPAPADPVPAAWAATQSSGRHLTVAPTGKVDMAGVMSHALATSPEIRMREVRAGVAAGDAAEIWTPDSPEIRFGYQRGQEQTEAWSSRSESGRSTETGGSLTQSTSTERQPGEAFGVSGDRTTSTSSSTETETKRSESLFSSTSSANERGDETGDGYAVGLRLTPPNPWLIRAAGRAADAGRGAADAELRREQQRLACDAVELMLRISYQDSMLRLSRRAARKSRDVEAKASKASAGGNLAHADNVGAALQRASASRDHEGLQARAEELKREFRLLTGLDPARVNFGDAREGRICRLGAAGNPTALEAVIPLLVERRPEMELAAWTERACEEEWRQARVKRYPWLSYIEASYAWWDGSEYSDRTFWETGEKYSSGTSTSLEEGTETPVQDPGGTGLADPEYPRYDSQSQWASESSRQVSSSQGNESGYETSSGEEWRIEAGIDIPVFEWISDEYRLRRRLAGETRDAVLTLERRLAEEIRLSGRALRDARAGLKQRLQDYVGQSNKLKELAATSRGQGLAGELDALRLEREILELSIGLLEDAMDVGLAELDFCRVAGILPGQAGIAAAAGKGQ